MKYTLTVFFACVLATAAAVAIIATRDVKTAPGVSESTSSTPASTKSESKKDDLSNLTFK